MHIDMSSFTPWSALAGGVLIGLGATLLLLFDGRMAGVSGITAGIIHPARDDLGWRLAFVAGLILAPVCYAAFAALPELRIDASYAILIAAGLLVGLGTRYASGCTSGHGVCGLARWSPRSLAATAAFMGAGFATVFLVRHVFAS
jgi:hypothetical protein